MIDAFSRWVELFPTKTTGASEAAGCIFQHFGRFGTPDVIHTDQGPAFRNELFSELSRLSQVEHSFATAYSKDEKELMRHLRAMLFDARVHDKWSDSHLLVESDPRITEYPVHLYVLFTPPVGRGNKLLPTYRGSLHEDAHSTGAQVATENLSQDFPRLFPALSWLVFPLGF